MKQYELLSSFLNGEGLRNRWPTSMIYLITVRSMTWDL
jgi:hypothetical protein